MDKKHNSLVVISVLVSLTLWLIRCEIRSVEASVFLREAGCNSKFIGFS